MFVQFKTTYKVSRKGQSKTKNAQCNQIVVSSISCPNTLLLQDFRQQKNQPFPIQCSRPSRDSQEPKTAKKFQFSRWLFQKIPFLYFSLHKSWIWRTLGHVMNISSKWHFHNASKEYFWSTIFSNFTQRFKSAILENLKNCQNGTFEPLHEIRN